MKRYKIIIIIIISPLFSPHLSMNIFHSFINPLLPPKKIKKKIIKKIIKKNNRTCSLSFKNISPPPTPLTSTASLPPLPFSLPSSPPFQTSLLVLLEILLTLPLVSLIRTKIQKICKKVLKLLQKFHYRDWFWNLVLFFLLLFYFFVIHFIYFFSQKNKKSLTYQKKKKLKKKNRWSFSSP